MRKGIWRELDGPQVKIDPYRRELQRSYLQAINDKLNPPPSPAGTAVTNGAQGPGRGPSSGDEKPLYRAELRTLSSSITAALAKTMDHETRAHLEAARDQIAKILDPEPASRRATPAAAGGRGGRGAR